MKKLRSDISHLKQSENELRQKCDQGSVIKSCLQVKQKENDELEKRWVNRIRFGALDLTEFHLFFFVRLFFFYKKTDFKSLRVHGSPIASVYT